ncbi:vanadium-dependent haloperoxidase [Tengunoibacter tsumagoiensis]|uniref:Haloperoxidase n=1 Tax=Tengunoibacter tsumagoiensis TaxID=2014871 RepID=A0A401ZVQ9_9CHLR|nr:vanadium-dependent haloperoxidase [Tengunoibacter tsumagoiensis]GCE10983.1 haloperoxidase [Tengunoibacter tsumagoiensis]
MEEKKIDRRRLLQLGATCFGTAWIIQPDLDAFAAEPSLSPSVLLAWNNMLLAAIRTTRPGVTIVARALAILHTCIYDAWAAYDRVAISTQYGGALRRPSNEWTLAHKEMAISFAAYRALVDLFPDLLPQFQALMSALGYDYQDTSLDSTTPQGIGNLSAQTLLTRQHHDGSNQLGDLHPGAYSDCTGYTPANTADQITNPNAWQPLRIPTGKGTSLVQRCVTPQWCLVKPFALTHPAQFRPSNPPATYPSRGYITQANDLLFMSASLTDEQKVIAEYWEDGPGSEQPPGHWCLFAQFIVQRDQHTLDQAVQLFFLLTNALFDASIACWDVKMTYNSERPITAIRYLFQGQQVRAWAGPYQGTRWIDGKDWKPYQPATFVTPAFPEYCSGHSTFSAASAEILRRFTGSDLFYYSYTKRAGSSVIEPGVVPFQDVMLYWHTFTEAAAQAGTSRRLGGIHFEQGDLQGRALGQAVGEVVWRKASAYIAGTQPV